MQHAISGLSLLASGLAVALAGLSWLRLDGDVGEKAALPSARPAPPSVVGQRLGEGMNRLARRFASLWFGLEHRNVPLVRYEIHELEETMEDITGLRLIEAGLDVANVLENMQESLFIPLEKAATLGDYDRARRLYLSAIEACNSCHIATKHPFVRIKLPTAPPVSNREWEVWVPEGGQK